MPSERRKPPKALYNIPEEAKPWGQKSDQWLPGLGKGRELTLRELEGTFWGNGNSLYIYCMYA